MVLPKEILTDYKELYEKASKYINDESKNDPITEPYRSHYLARDVLLGMYENLKNTMNSIKAEIESNNTNKELEEDYFTYEVIVAFICRDLGRIYIFTDESSCGEAKLAECIELMDISQTRPEAIIPYIGGLNELGILYSNRGEHKTACELLKKAEDAYLQFKETDKEALSITDIFGTKDEIERGKGSSELEKLYTLCIFYMAQVHGHLGNLERSAHYCHKTLCRQLADNSYEPIDFSLNAATLSQYFIKKNLFKQARHHLAAATKIMSEYEQTMITPNMDEEDIIEVQDRFKHRFADVGRCWAKYGLALLSSSRERLLSDDKEKLAMDIEIMSLNENFCFPDFDISDYENRVQADFCLVFDDAKGIYHFVISWLDLAQGYYKIETEATEYAKIIKDYAELYEFMAFFEENSINQMKMHKRRARYYDELQDKLNPMFYMSICRECWYGSGIAYCDMLNVKLDMVKGIKTPSPNDILKINQICTHAIKTFEKLIQSFHEKNKGVLKKNIDVDDARLVLCAYFYMGRLHFKMITPNPIKQWENMQASLENYKTFLRECAERPEAAASLQGEIGVTREMVNLLPLKIASFKERLHP